MIERENVKFIKLTSGEEILAEVQYSNDCLVLKNPVAISLREMENGKVGLSMLPWINLSDSDSFTVSNIHVITSGTPLNDLIEGYIRAHSKIVVPPSGLVL
jgi:hypothetical protein